MSEANFTKGPWRWEVNLKHKSVVLTGGKPKFDKDVLRFERYGMQGAQPTFCEVGDRDIQGEKASDLACVIEGREHHEAWFRGLDHPDAHLIAAAPEMHDKLEECVTVLREGTYSEINDCADEILVLLAKARGEA